MTEQLMTAKEVAELLQVHLSTVYLWTDQGYLPHICLSQSTRRRCIRFRRSELEAWLDARAQAGRIDRLPGGGVDSSGTREHPRGISERR